MRILLRDAQTRMLMGIDENWTQSIEEAVGFPDLETAGKRALQHTAQELEVVLHYDEPLCELAINPVYCARQ